MKLTTLAKINFADCKKLKKYGEISIPKRKKKYEFLVYFEFKKQNNYNITREQK